MRAALMLLMLALCGCHAQYHVELWNDTAQTLNVGIVERRTGEEEGPGRPRVDVPPGGWLDYSLERGPRRPVRYARVRGESGRLDVDMTDRQVFRGRVSLDDGVLRVEPITPAESDARRRR